MYELVENIEDYPKFLPWCEGSSFLVQDDGSIIATVDVVFKGIPFAFTTINYNEPYSKITMRLSKGPFKSMYGYWEFVEIDHNSCDVNFFLEYTFSNFIIERTTGYIFNEISQSMMDSFIKQADKIE
jgi:ribosome-associated toxin RatA of RatAB toxin-antitoxin module